MRNVFGRKLVGVSAALAAAAAILGLTGCDKLRGRDQRNQGVHDFSSAKYSDAIEHFTKAVQYDPSDPVNRLYLATAYFAQWIPGAESPQNQEYAARARAEFKKVLDQDPKDVTALQYLGSMAYNEALPLPTDQKLAKFNEAADWNRKLLDADPNNKQAYYYLGVIAYNRWHPALGQAELDLHMKPDDPGPLKDKKVRDSLKMQYGALLDEGIANLQKSLDIDKDYADAMAYEQLLIREKAYLDDDATQYAKDLDKANDLLEKALATKKANAAKAASSAAGGIVEDAK